MKLFFQRKLRSLALRFEYLTSKWVIPNSTEICSLIENTDKPNVEEFFARVKEAEDRWKIYDPEINAYRVRGRLKEFMIEHKLKK